MRLRLIHALLAISAGSCATTQRKSLASRPDELLKAACEPGMALRGVEGSIWMKLKSPEAQGQFPALLKVENENQLRLEVTDLIGGTVAQIQVDGSKYRVAQPGRPIQEGGDSWGGIPLRWASGLLLGRIPCPKERQQVRTLEDGGLEIRSGDERFVYSFRSFDDAPWPQALVWTRGASVVTFRFSDPENGSRSPLSWRAQSDRGEVDVRWRKRAVIR
jgi:hypothetical protein